MEDKEKVKRSLSIPLHLSTLVITIVIFAVGIWIGNGLASQVNDQFYNEIDSLQTSNVNLEVLSLLESDPAIANNLEMKATLCKAVEDSAHNLGVQTADVGRRLRLFEAKRGQTNDVLALEQRYFALESRDYLFWKRLKNLCGTDLTLVLYFYTSNCGECTAYDEAIGQFKQQNPGNILAYSFNLDYKETMPSIAILSSMYKTTNAPTVIVNDETLNEAPTLENLQKLA
ncbi:MAG: hypothetical protein V1722_03845 [Candidatus Micrarchaeota archaeon]